ncbi:MAG: hypothetical protein AB4426_05735 [Xenococcaceae cyanobacterium]
MRTRQQATGNRQQATGNSKALRLFTFLNSGDKIYVRLLIGESILLMLCRPSPYFARQSLLGVIPASVPPNEVLLPLNSPTVSLL